MDGTASLIPSISIEGLLAARDNALQALAEVRALLTEAQAGLLRFDMGLPRVEVMFPGAQYRPLLDERMPELWRKEVDRLAWAMLFAATNVDQLMDSGTRRKLSEHLHSSALDGRHSHGYNGTELPELTAENIRSTFEQVHAGRAGYFEKCVESVYRGLSWDHKTNTPGLIGEVLIVRGLFYHWGRTMQGESTSLTHHDTLHDLERVLCVLDSQPPPVHGVGLRSMHAVPWGVWTQVPYAVRPLLEVKVHRNGNSHVRILHAEHVQAMNKIMAKLYPSAIGTGDRRKKRGKGA